MECLGGSGGHAPAFMAECLDQKGYRLLGSCSDRFQGANGSPLAVPVVSAENVDDSPDQRPGFRPKAANCVTDRFRIRLQKSCQDVQGGAAAAVDFPEGFDRLDAKSSALRLIPDQCAQVRNRILLLGRMIAEHGEDMLVAKISNSGNPGDQ